jgi:hypothetical protein
LAVLAVIACPNILLATEKISLAYRESTCLPRVGKEIQNRFPYAFTEDKYPGAPSFEITEIGNEPFIIENTEMKLASVI